MNNGNRLTESMHRTLEALAEFRYLTMTQMVDLGVSRNYSHIAHKVTRDLITPPFEAIGSHDFGVIPGIGKLHKVFYLTERGAEILAEATQQDVSDIKYPVRGVQFSRDYFHRLAYVDFCISFANYMRSRNLPIFNMTHYFDKIGKPRKGTALHSETRLALTRGYIVPDGLFFFDSGEKKRVVSVEIHYSPRTSNIVKQLETHFLALRELAASSFFGHDKSSFVLSVFNDEATCDRVRSYLLNDSEFRNVFFPLFHFNTIGTIKARGFNAGWMLADGTAPEKPLFA